MIRSMLRVFLLIIMIIMATTNAAAAAGATAAPCWNSKKQEDFERADASQDEAWFSANWPMYAEKMADHAIESFPTMQWKCFRKWLKVQQAVTWSSSPSDSTKSKDEDEENKSKLWSMLDKLDRAEHQRKADEIHDYLTENPAPSMAALLSGPHLFKMMERTSRGQAPPADDPVPLPQLGPGEDFTMTMKMMKDETTGQQVSAQMTPTIIKADGTKVRMNADGTASDEVIDED